MKLIKLHKQSKSEDKNIYPFLKEYCKNLRGKIQYEAIDENIRGKTPDYYIDKIYALVEIKEVHDTKDRRHSAQWGRIVGNLRKQIRENRKLKRVKGLYSIGTPSTFKFPTDKKQIKVAAGQILDAVIKGESSIALHNITFKIEKVSDKDSGVYFSAKGLGGSFDPAQTIHQNIQNKLTTANKQLGYTPKDKNIEKKVLLLVNQYPLLHWDWDLYKALSYSYNQLLTYDNIDEIWFQNPTKDGSYTHDLLYTKKFLYDCHDQRLKPTEQNAELFASWFSALEKLGDDHKEKLFVALKKFLDKKKPHKWFENTTVREEMVKLGVWLADKGRFNDVDWLIDQFIGDPDPVEPDKYTGDPETNYHQQIINGEDPHIIATVLGHLAWVIQKLASQRKGGNKKYTLKAFEYTKQLLKHKNLYVKLQAIIPLIEIVKRKQWIEGYGKRDANGKRIGQYQEFHRIVFKLVELVEKNPTYIALAKWLSHVFAYYKDLNTKEAEQVLAALKITSESAELFVYFGIYRKNHYKDQGIKFDGTKLEEKLKKVIKNKNGEYDEDLRGSLAWHIWKLLKENPNEFDTLLPYVDLFVRQPYSRGIHSNVERIIEDWVKKRPNICIPWFGKLIKNVSKYVGKDEDRARNVWLTSPEEVIETVAKEKPGKLLDYMQILVELWKKNIFVGSPKRLFESYSKVKDTVMKSMIKKKFKQWYKEMKKLNPKLETVNWK